MQLYPAIDIRGGKCVRLRQGDYNDETIFGDDPVEMALKWKEQGAEWLHLVDLDGAKEGRPVNHEVVKQIVTQTGIPCEMGGGIRNDDSIRLAIEELGLSRVIIGTKALKEPDWFADACQRFPHKLALGLDARDSMVATEGWLEVSKVSAMELAKQFLEVPISAVIYTNIANDGMMQGVDADTLADLRTLAEMGLPVIASGGVTTMDDIHTLHKIAAEVPTLIGAIVGRAIYEGTIDVAEACAALRS
ncbi:1-(5-phosphoribosyl)-5-[(5-phosphoribosylamino)methylideneamino]imidazole-4-carboxamide isomerase [Fuerstiella marisgermanici]|uniref:1-(5-phosphoribosyl)-5-[(5-phosphoribosylamino)methylideneamino] imidazole-4-carboxamide isomerase n=1 Tax=Fuerstiella marisgermanici TaxID=1891926 RepID=A0A1P8W9I2_9PLAN|nr:1-(5-phosphoribosyl)-5-[(5-phosphoribosylamino)methylideneamino]imidazole-4-carboxamide isomerase [Fuerstiella marisgermanici]APZ90718.1 1-(5-phosphoribosyl)-5-[(5-phosphoribosylamino)methylideneamino] imidazole-4-carboxamide isomerase [Fuerstiella marisgermanici]